MTDDKVYIELLKGFTTTNVRTRRQYLDVGTQTNGSVSCKQRLSVRFSFTNLFNQLQMVGFTFQHFKTRMVHHEEDRNLKIVSPNP
jgi:hypothetical protein